jgi:hypothetical protein
MSDVALSSTSSNSSSSVLLHQTRVITANRSRSLDELLGLCDDDENDMDCIDHTNKISRDSNNGRSFPTRSKSLPGTNPDNSNISSIGQFNQSSSRFRRQRMFQLQQSDETIGGSTASSSESFSGSLTLSMPDTPQVLERSVIRRSTSSQCNNPFALLDDDDDDFLGKSPTVNHPRTTTSSSNSFLQLQPASFEIPVMDNYGLNNSSVNGKLVDAFSNVILEAENEEDDDL